MRHTVFKNTVAIRIVILSAAKNPSGYSPSGGDAAFTGFFGFASE
jgi:hypothetical protein